MTQGNCLWQGWDFFRTIGQVVNDEAHVFQLESKLEYVASSFQLFGNRNLFQLPLSSYRPRRCIGLPACLMKYRRARSALGGNLIVCIQEVQ